MSLSVLEVLENALFNLRDGKLPFQRRIGIEQLENAIEQLEENSDADAEYVGDNE